MKPQTEARLEANYWRFFSAGRDDWGFPCSLAEHVCWVKNGESPDHLAKIAKVPVSYFANIADAIKEDRTAEDLLFQVFLDCGLDLALPVAKEKITGQTVYTVNHNDLAACFASDISEELIRELAKRQPLKAVFLDRSFAKDSAKLNVTQIFKQLSPHTEVKTL